MRGGTYRERGEKVSASELATLQRGEVLCDRHRQECYQVSGIDTAGIALHRDGRDFYIPRSLFVSWYGQRLFSIEETRSIETPEWCRQHRDDRTETETESDPRNVIGVTTE